MKFEFIILGLLVLVQLGQGMVIYRQKKKLDKALFISRDKDSVFFNDATGKIIDEKIKINIK